MRRGRIVRWIVTALALLAVSAVGIMPAGAKGDSPLLAVDVGTGHVFVASRLANTVSMIDATSGHILRTVAMGGPAFAPFAMAVDARTSRLFAVTTTGPTGSIAVLDTRTGKLLRTGPSIASPQAVTVDAYTNRAFVLSSMATVDVLNAWTGAVVRVGQTRLAVYTAATAPRSGHIFAGGADEVGVVAMLDARTGALLRTIGGPPRNDVGGGMMAVDNSRGHVFAVGSHGVSELDATSGRVLRTIGVGQNPWTVVADERAARVFVATENGVKMLDARNGAILHTVAPRDSFNQLAVDETTQRGFAVRSDGTLFVFDTRSGRVVRVTANASGASLAVDERRGRVFVLDVTGVSVLNAVTGTVIRTIAFFT